jgi:hypothetical protein
MPFFIVLGLVYMAFMIPMSALGWLIKLLYPGNNE